MRFSAALSFSFLASALAYQVIEPSATKGWTDSGPQTLTWVRADTDPLNFTVVLTNADRNIMPQNNQVLAAQVDGNLKALFVNPPSGGWPAGGSFRVNFAKNTDELDTLYAQSSAFDIEPPATTYTSTGRTSATRTVASSTESFAPSTTIRPTSIASAPAQSTGITGPDMPALNAGPKALSVHASLVPIFAALCLFLA